MKRGRNDLLDEHTEVWTFIRIGRVSPPRCDFWWWCSHAQEGVETIGLLPETGPKTGSRLCGYCTRRITPYCEIKNKLVIDFF